MNSGARLLIEGRVAALFVDRALREGARIRKCETLDERRVRLTVSLRDAEKIALLAGRFGVRCTREGCAGLEGLLARLRSRSTLAAGLCALLAVAALLLSRVWEVRVLPVDGASEAVVEKAGEILAEMGVRTGMAASDVDRPLLRARLAAEVPEAGYVSVKRQGVCLTVSVSEAEPQPEVFDLSRTRSVVARYDALVERVDVFAGQAEVERGDVVRQGQRLIAGWERTGAEELSPVAADGVVLARVWLTEEAEAPLTARIERPTGRTRTAEALILPWGRVVMARAEPFEAERVTVEPLPVGGVFAPVYVERTIREELTFDTYRQSEEDVKRKLRSETEAALDVRVPEGAELVDKWTDYSMIDGERLRVRETYELLCDIAAAGRGVWP